METEKIARLWVEVPPKVWNMAESHNVRDHYPDVLRNVLNRHSPSREVPQQVLDQPEGIGLPCVEFEDILIIRRRDV